MQKVETHKKHTYAITFVPSNLKFQNYLHSLNFPKIFPKTPKIFKYSQFHPKESLSTKNVISTWIGGDQNPIKWDDKVGPSSAPRT